MLEKLIEIYGEFDETTTKWISENLEKLGEENEQNFLKCLQEEHSRRQGKPDIHKLNVVLEKVTGKKTKGFIWAVCLECGCEYDYCLPMCPACFDKGLDCRTRAVKKSEFQPPAKVIRYNKQYQNGDKGEKICYYCEHRKTGYCKNFGNPNWNCKREEFEMCDCKLCCGVAKKINRQLDEKNKTEKYSYAMPIKRG